MLRLRSTLSALCFGALVTAGHAAVLFSENFQSQGTLDTTKWDLLGANVFVFNAALVWGNQGSNALVLQGDFAYDDGARAKLAFTRNGGNGLVNTFRVYRDAGALTGTFNGINGPWVDTNVLSGSFPSLEQVEAGIGRENGTGAITYIEGSPSANFDSTAIGPGLRAALDAATSPNNAVTIRVTLGATSGARLEWSTDGVNFTIDKDTIGQVAGTPTTGGNVVSGSNTVYLWFGCSGGTGGIRFWIDDIIVSDNTPGAGDLTNNPMALNYSVGSGYEVNLDNGTTRTTQTLTLSNSGAGTLEVKNLQFTGTDASLFRIINRPTVPFTIAPAQNLNLVVEYAPPANYALGRSAALEVTTDDPSPVTTIPIIADTVPVELSIIE